MNKTHKAEVIEIVPPKVQIDSFTGQRYQIGNYVVVKDETGQLHNFINGSMNGIVNPEVGMKGIVTYHSSSSYGLWFFTRDKK